MTTQAYTVLQCENDVGGTEFDLIQVISIRCNLRCSSEVVVCRFGIRGALVRHSAQLESTEIAEIVLEKFDTN